jgi:pimeloyl-ACP methyl ester carboxylesterase
MATTSAAPSIIGSSREHAILATDGVRLACREYGSRGAAHTVVLLHGLCLSQTTWSRQINALLRQWRSAIRIFSFDYRGHGTSQPAPVRTYTIDQVADDIAHILTVLHVAGHVVLAGHSMGGMAALTYQALPAHRRPINPAGLVLAASSAGGLAEQGLGRLLTTPALGLLAETAGHLPHRLAHDAMRILARPACRALSTAAGLGPTELASLTGTTADALTHTTLAAAIGFLPSLRCYDQLGALSTITAATVVISGGKDLLTPAHHAAALTAGIPHATHICAPAAGHMLLHDAAQTVTDAINTAISSVAIPASRNA